MLKSGLKISRLRLAECYGNQTTCYVIHTLEGEPIKATPTTHQTPKGSRFGFPKAAHQFWRPNVFGMQVFADVVSHTVSLPPKGLGFETQKVGLLMKQYLCIALTVLWKSPAL